MTCNAVDVLLAAVVVVDFDDIDPMLLPLAELPPAANNGLKQFFPIVLCSCAVVGSKVVAGGRSGGVLNANNDDAANGERPNRDDEIGGNINAVTNFRAAVGTIIPPNFCDGGSTEK